MKSVAMALVGPGVTYPDPLIVGFFTASLVICAYLALADPMLEIRMLFNGIAIDRRGLRCGSIFVTEVPKLVHPIIVALMLLFVVGIPILYIVSILVLSTCGGPHKGPQCLQYVKLLAFALRGWCHLDVFAIAVFLFLFMVQDPKTVTLIPTGSLSFYFVVGSGWAFFFLKWFSEGDPQPPGSCTRPVRVSWRLLISVGASFVACAAVFGGVPGQIPQNHFRDLDSICRNTQPMLDNSLKMMPASVGNCEISRHSKAAPPLPCAGDADLYSVNHTKEQQAHGDDGYIKAVWLSGLNTANFSGCHLWRNASQPAKPAVYNLQITGTFAHLNLFLDAKICNGLVGCEKLFSDDHCCGKHINFVVDFEMQCLPGARQRRELSNLKIKSCKVDSMFVRERLYGGLVTVDAMDIAPQVQRTVAQKIQYYMDNVNVTWGGNALNLAEFVNRLVSYNAPTQDFEC